MSAKKQKLHFLLMLFMLVSGLVLLASCRPDLAKINNIFIQKNGLTVESSLELDLYVASEHTFTVLIDKEGDISEAVIFASSNAAVATITPQGVLTLLSKGVTTISATSVADNSVSASFVLTVVDSSPEPSITSVIIDSKGEENKIQLPLSNDEVTFTATVVVVGGASENVIWESSNTQVAIIDSETGVLTFIGVGVTNITATSVFDDTKFDIVEVTVLPQDLSKPDTVPFGWKELQLVWTADGSYGMYSGPEIDGKMPYFERVSNNYFKSMNINPGGNTFNRGDFLRFGVWAYSNKEQIVTINIPYGYNPQNAPKTYTLEANTWTWIQTDKYPASDRINGYIQANSADTLYLTGMQIIKEINPGPASIVSVKIIQGAVPSDTPLNPNSTYGGASGIQVETLTIEKTMGIPDFYIVPLVAAAAGASQSVTWESSDPNVATVTKVASTATNTYGFNSELGLVHLVGGGQTTLTVRAVDDPTKFATVILNVDAPLPSVLSVFINGKNQEGKIERDIADGNFTLTSLVSVVGGASQEVVWTSSDTDVATIDPNTGLVTVIAQGTTTITATSVLDDTKLDTVDLIIGTETVPLPDDIPEGWEEIELNWTAGATYVRYEGGAIDGRMPYFVRTSNNYIKMLNVNPGASTFTKGDYLRFGAWVYSNKEQVVTINIPYGYNSQNVPKTYTLEANTWTWIQTDKYPASDRINPYIQANGADVLYVSGMQLIKESVAGDPEIHSIRIITNANPTAGTLGSNGTYSGAQVSNIEINKQITDDDFYIVPLVAAAFGASQSVIWESSDPNVATVTGKNPPASNYGYNSEIGLVHIVGAGTVTLTVKSVDDPTKFATVTLTVPDSAPSVLSVLINGKSQEGEIKRDIAEGNFTLTSTVIVVGGASKEVIWESSDTDIATIDSNTGLVTVIAKGTTTITATSVFDDTKLDVADLVISDETVPAPDAIADGWEEIELNWTADPTYIRYDGDPVDGRMPYFVRASNNYIKMMNVNPGANTFTKGDYLRFGAWVYSNK
ncbi:MAG: hypothetical protein GX794_04020, partial [Acholeplasmataceae bacterium]|nr:hypothetical protein [Acholeplasmataceae bacterium]